MTHNLQGRPKVGGIPAHADGDQDDAHVLDRGKSKETFIVSCLNQKKSGYAGGHETENHEPCFGVRCLYALK